MHGEKALIISKALYENADIFLDRKYQNYLINSTWTKKSMKGIIRKKWSEIEEQDLMNMTDIDFHNKYPERTLVAIRSKRQKLKKEVMNDVNK